MLHVLCSSIVVWKTGFLEMHMFLGNIDCIINISTCRQSWDNLVTCNVSYVILLLFKLK